MMAGEETAAQSVSEDGIMEEEEHQKDHEKKQHQQRWGWGSWGSMLTDLQKAATEAAQEISKNAMQAAKGAAMGMTELQANVVESLASKDSEETKDKLLDECPTEELRKSALEKLEGASQDSLLGHGLKVLDGSVESLATGAFQALGTAWKGGVNLVQKLEHSAEHLAGSIQSDGFTGGALAPRLIQGGKELTAKGLQALEYVGRETMDILAIEAGIDMDDNQSGKAVGDMTLEDATFDRCFYIYGGPEHLEELEALSNHYTLLCNRAKAKMMKDQRAAFDGLLKQLQQLLTLDLESSTATDKGKQVEKIAVANENEMKALRESSVSKAAEMATGFAATLGGLALNDVVKKTADRLEAIKGEGVHRLSEICAVCMSHFLHLGKSVLAKSSNSEKKSDDDDGGFEWPEDCIGKASMIKNRAKDIAGDIEAVSDGFLTGVGDVIAAFEVAMQSDGSEGEVDHHQSIQDKAHQVSSDLQSDGSAAIEKLQDGLQHLVYVVLSTSL